MKIYDWRNWKFSRQFIRLIDTRVIKYDQFLKNKKVEKLVHQRPKNFNCALIRIQIYRKIIKLEHIFIFPQNSTKTFFGL